MTWNHRVVRTTHTTALVTYAVHEVYYDEHGTITVMTENAVHPMGETLDELTTDIERFKEALRKPVLERNRAKGEAMRYTIDGKEYSVRFQHKNFGPKIGGTTVCIIEQVEGSGPATKVLHTYTGQAQCSVKDQWNRRDGRRVSLARTFKALAEQQGLSKGARALFWQAYFARTRKEQFRP